jgi:diguanylate cyclase (GGDEF)-like protein
LLDIEGFKHINDAFGHDQGDALLQQVARRLTTSVRASDTVARLHADEFALVLPWTDANGAILATRKVQRVLEMRFCIGERSVAIDTTIGIAIAPEHGNDPDILLRHANVAQSAARSSRSGYALYAPGQESVTLRLKVHNRSSAKMHRGFAAKMHTGCGTGRDSDGSVSLLVYARSTVETWRRSGRWSRFGERHLLSCESIARPRHGQHNGPVAETIEPR